MVNHPNRNWRSRWTVDLEESTASHRDGWIFKFSPASDQPGVFDGTCINHPKPLTIDNMQKATRLAREAGDIYLEARQARH